MLKYNEQCVWTVSNPQITAICIELKELNFHSQQTGIMVIAPLHAAIQNNLSVAQESTSFPKIKTVPQITPRVSTHILSCYSLIIQYFNTIIRTIDSVIT
jgi:hypothetical protein